LENAIYTSGFRNDIPDLLNAVDVFCLPSLWEGLSIALLEAMAMRKAVLVTPTDGTSEIIQDGMNGTVTNFSSFEMLAAKMLDLFSNPDKVRNEGENAMMLVKNRFNSQKVSESVEKLYERFRS
jgi:glycosyltransferase involved in cell wall biosynthesis